MLEDGQDKQERGVASSRQKLRIAIVSDFFYPNVGGVEGHIYALSQHLVRRGHKVIIITHHYSPDRKGVRYLASGVKVYHIGYHVIARQDSLPNFFGSLPVLRSILIRESITIVHAHQALSSMGLETLLHARTLGLRCVFTDHSLFGFADAASILTNKLLHFFLSDVDAVICVSHTAKENTILRANIRDPQSVYVIPNAVVSEQFKPADTSKEARTKPVSNGLVVVILSRLMYRKGIDLLLGSIPRLCELHPDISFVIGGDGPKRVELEQMRERHALYDRVELCGAIRQGCVRDHLVRGDIFLNTSLTEAFGTGIIEAASCGLFIVSTNVGGIPEVLPSHMIRLTRPDERDIVEQMSFAIMHVRAAKHNPDQSHAQLRQMYAWDDVAARVQHVYTRIQNQPLPLATERWQRYRRVGPIAGLIFCIIAAVDMLFLGLLNWLVPIASIDCVDSYEATERSTSSPQKASSSRSYNTTEML